MNGYHHCMQPVLTPSSASKLDHGLIAEYSLSEPALIDNAAMGVFNLTASMIAEPVTVLVGPGNNGSDGIALASILHDKGFNVSVLYLYEKGNAENLRRRKNLSPAIPVVENIPEGGTIYDALFGFSFHGEADERLRKIAEDAEKADIVISVDVPSGGIMRSDVTVSLMMQKTVLYMPSAAPGTILEHNPGFPEKELRLSPDSVYLLSDSDSSMKSFRENDYKNTRGHVCIAGGSDRYTGAPRLAARAAFFAGAGLVTIATESERIRDENPAVMITPPSSDYSRFSSVVAGPGWDKGNENVFEDILESGRPVVIDADGLKFVPHHSFHGNAVLTPHVGEYRRLCAALGIDDALSDPDALPYKLREIASHLDAVIVLKASSVWIADADAVYIYHGANPSLGVAGSGDVLSGIIGALLAAGEKPLNAAIDGVILHQRAGRNAHNAYGFYSAEELILEVGKAR